MTSRRGNMCGCVGYEEPPALSLVSVHWRKAVGRKLAEANEFGFLNIF